MPITDNVNNAPIGDVPPIGSAKFEFREADTLEAQKLAATVQELIALRKRKEKEAEYDAINPAHYQGFSNEAEVIDIAENLTYNRGAAIKYLARAGNKPGSDVIEDLTKAAWYVQRELDRIKGVIR